MSRKTFEVAKLLERVNHYNRTSADEFKAHREAGNTILESILHETGNYSGFQYLYDRELSAQAKSVGIREGEAYEDWFKDTDPSRVAYL